ncbi:uncharacterized protein N7500_001163 [Penicillium coprophilum]|uniref:uncharacterized protein n=1 Tax=Penicillium coprophilum TaxID=36646 RepID=UPI0023946FF3|nr:uncharacterized protein N7500_001163 [Penicillium coprophilum]KAJ5178464.1 hypothetical protein N7500_001163 [Penicillium coprophilum]
MPTGLMTSRHVNDELMSRRVCNYHTVILYFTRLHPVPEPLISIPLDSSGSKLLFDTQLSCSNCNSYSLTIMLNSHLNDLNYFSLCGSRQAAISRNYQKSNFRKKCEEPLGNPERPVFTIVRVMAGQNSSLSGPAKARTRQPGFLLFF